MNNNSNKIKIYRKIKMSIDRTVNVHVSYVQMKFDELLSDVQYWRVLCVVHVGYGLGEKFFLCLFVLVLSDL